MLLHDIARRLAQRLRIYREIERLKTLDDVLLADMGIRRSEITDRVTGRC